MDFLDPRKQRAHHRRIMVGYLLMSIVVLLGTIILVYGANGYSVNTKTGAVIENGLLFVDSKPSGTEIYLNGQDTGEQTSARKVLPTGTYSLKLSKAGYRDWARSFVLEEHSIERFVYPFLFPVKPVSSSLKKYSAQPSLLTVSPDRHWLLIFYSENGNDKIDQIDTTNLDIPATTLGLPASLLTSPGATSGYKLVEWSTDNKHVLVERSYPGGSEFLMLNRDTLAESLNVNKTLNINLNKVVLRDKKFDQLYVRTTDGQLWQADLDGTQLTSILKNVLEFKAYGNNLLLYTTNGLAGGQEVTAKLWDNGQSYILAKLIPGQVYLLDMAKFQNGFYVVVGSSGGDGVSLYKDPFDSLKDPKNGKALPFITLRLSNAQKTAFSDNARFVEAQSGQKFAVYDLEAKRYYKYATAAKLVQPVQWMDGHRLIGMASGKVFVMDFDRTNQQSLVSTVWMGGGVFDRDYNNLFTLSAASGGGFSLVDVDMRAGSDLPANKR